MNKRIGFVGLCCVVAMVGCGDDGGGGRPDAGDSGTDAIITLDGAMDSGADTSVPGDSGADTSTPDGGIDCEGIGDGCDTARGCRRGECIGENAGSIGGAADPIVGLPSGDSLPQTSWEGGYCTPVLPTAAAPEACDPDADSDPTCGSCGTCVSVGGTPNQAICFLACEPSTTDRGVCRAGYECNLNVEGCFPGCGSDDECKISRENTNGIEGIQSPDDCAGDSTRAVADQVCGGTDSNFDALTYNTESTATCNPATSRCSHAGTAGASGGDTCTNDEMCEADGRCLDEASFEWPGGACTKFRCDLPGNECAGDAVCQDRGLGVFLCLDGCTVAAGSDAGDPTTWLGNTGGCRDGYTCMWNGVDGAGVAGNGACVPSETNDVTDNNVGGACADDADCWSAFGRGLCLSANDDGTGFRDGYCTVLDCLAPGIPANVCGGTGECVDLDGSDGDVTGCLTGCDSPDACRDQYACSDLDGDPSTIGGVCVPNCGTDDECKTAEHCEIPAGDTFGDCVPD